MANSPQTPIEEGSLKQRATTELRPFDWQADADANIPDAASPIIADLVGSILSLDGRTASLDILAATQDLAYGAPGIAHAVLPTLQAALLIQRCGSEAQRERLLARLTAVGENAARVLLIESNGRGTAEWSTTARRDGDVWTVNGRKVAVNDNEGHLYVVVASTEGGAVEIFAVDGKPQGLSLRNAPAQPTMALGASRLGTIDLNDVSLSEDDRLDQNGVEALRSVALCRLMLGAISLGAATASLDYARGWVVKRTAFGKLLSAFEGVAFDVADVDTRLQAAQYRLRQVAHDIQSMDDPEAIDDLVARTLSRVTSVCASAATDGVQLMGVHGIIHEHPQELFHRTASALSVLDADPLRAGFQLL